MSHAKNDPFKTFLQYPEALHLIGLIDGLKVLDIGCGPGLLTEQLAQNATVIGYDNSVKQIAQALENPLRRANYIIADPHQIEEEMLNQYGGIRFDKALSTMVLQYSRDTHELDAFFSSTSRLLNEQGILASIIYNPDHQIDDAVRYQRKWSVEGKKLRVHFLDPTGKTVTSAVFNEFSRENYETAARKSGFSLEWVNLKPSKAGIEALGEPYWREFLKNPAYIGFISRKK